MAEAVKPAWLPNAVWEMLPQKPGEFGTGFISYLPLPRALAREWASEGGSPLPTFTMPTIFSPAAPNGTPPVIVINNPPTTNGTPATPVIEETPSTPVVVTPPDNGTQPQPTPTTPGLTFGALTGSAYYLQGYHYPLVQCVITNNTGEQITNRVVSLHLTYTGAYGTPASSQVTLESTLAYYGTPVYKPAAGKITLRPGESKLIDQVVPLVAPRDVKSTVWLEDDVTKARSNSIVI